MWFDGWERVLGGGVPMIPYYEPIIINHLADDASLTMSNIGQMDGATGEVTVHIEVESVEVPTAQLRIAIIEHNMVSDDTYHYVCRDFLPEETLNISFAGQTFDITRNFTISPAWNTGNLDVVTFVQYDGNHHILQSCMGMDFTPGDVQVALEPVGMPIVIPASGGSFDFNIAVTNNQTSGWAFDVWTDVTLPTGGTFGPIIGPLTVILGAGSTVDRDRSQNVPAGAPEGMYSYNAYVGNYPDDVWYSDSFDFEKSAVADGSGIVGDWFSSGESLTSTPTASPTEFVLHQNYPNPFNPETTIGFDLPEATSVTLSVYDVTGRQVATLVDGHRNAGHHEVTWDASAYSAGVYIYRLSAGNFTTSGKMVLMK